MSRRSKRNPKNNRSGKTSSSPKPDPGVEDTRPTPTAPSPTNVGEGTGRRAGWWAANGLAIVALVFALTGNANGIRQIWHDIFATPKLVFQNSLITISDAEILFPEHKGSAMLLLSGSMANAGSKALIPAGFRLEAKISGRRRVLIPYVIPVRSDLKLRYHGTNTFVYVSPSELDLVRFTGNLEPDQVKLGHLLFVVDDVTLENLADFWPQDMKLICVDVFGTQYETTLKPETPKIGKDGFSLPNLGISVPGTNH